MSDKPRPTRDNPDDGPDCPECGTTTEVWIRILDEETDERSSVINCPNCDFDIESESNLAREARQERLAEEMEADLSPSDIK